MSNKFYSYEVNYLMENSLSPSLNILLEKEEEKKEEEKKEEESFGDEDIFGDESSEGGEGEEGGESSGSNLSGDSDDESEEIQSDDSPEVGVGSEAIDTKLSNLENLADQIKDVSGYLRSVTNKTDIFQVQDFLSNDITSKSAESGKNIEEGLSNNKYSLNKNNKISYFLNEKISIKDIEDDIEAVDNIIDKGSELIDKFKKGSELNIPQYVESSINAYRNFDNLFSKESIIKQAAMNLIILNSGARAEENIREFEELFHEELHKQFGIEYEEHAIITKPHHVATGAVKQG